MKRPIGIVFFLLMPMQFAYAEHDHDIDQVKVQAPIIDSRILKHPATVETYDRQQIADSINAATVAQTLKYLPSIQVRERFIGDRNGIIATRTAGTLSSAQSMLYADGVLLSNLLGNSFAYPPRWGLIMPEEVESISMMYGPFSALYAGNSFGGVMSLHTRMPEKLESHATMQTFIQDFSLYGTSEHYQGQHLTASLGNKVNDFAFWLGVDYLENKGQPMGFSTSTVSPMRIEPPSGCSSPMIIRNSVVLPAPFGPITPTMPAGGKENERSSINSFSPKAFVK